MEGQATWSRGRLKLTSSASTLLGRFHRRLTNLGVELLCLTFGMLSLDCTGSEHMLGTSNKLLLPVLDSIRVHIELPDDYHLRLTV